MGSTSEHTCGWKAEEADETPSAIIRRVVVKKKKKTGAASLTVADIQAIKDVVNKLGADTVKELADVLKQ